MLYIFSSTDKLLTVLSEDTGLIETHFKDYQNLIQDETFTFSVHQSKKYSQSYDTFYNLTQVAGSFIGTIDKIESTVNVSPIEFIEEENQVAFYDKDNELRLMRMKELTEITEDGQSIIKVICEPAYLELYDHFIEDKRIVEGTAQLALNRALEGSRYVGEVTLDLGNATDNFYWIDGVEAVFSILDTWGGALKDTITLDDNNNIIERKLWINARLGADNGLIVEPDYNAESIERKTLSYIETALWGQGSSLEIEDEEGELTGGHTRYITFEDVVWSKSKGDPANKPKGQKWVGDEDARLEHGYIHNGVRKHRFGHFSNQDYETPEELLMATWQALQERKLKEVVHEASIYEDEKGASLGDTVTILNREYSKPIELQSQITGLEYDLLYPKELDIIIGKYIDMSEDPLQKEVDDLKVQAKKPPKPITDISFPDIKPGTPVNFTATGAFQTIQLFWDYDSKVYISHYEVYGSQISDFVPDEQHLLYRGRVSAFSHEVETDEMWYYYVRAVNTRGTAGEFSHRVSASSVRVISDDILFGEDLATELRNLSSVSQILADNTIDYSQIKHEVKNIFGGRNLISHLPNAWESVITMHITHAVIEPQTEYTLSNQSTGLNEIESFNLYDINRNRTRQFTGLTQDFTFTTNSNEVEAEIIVVVDDIEFENKLSKEYRFKLEKGDASTPFEEMINDIRVDEYAFIQTGVIGTAAIADLAVDRFHLKQGIIDNAHIADATIEHGKIKSLNADKITVGDLKGIDIYGAKFRSSAGTDYMEIVGGEIDLMLNNGRYMHLSPTGLYGYNAGGSVRFQADQSMVTSAVLGTSTANVYLAAQSGQEARMVTYTDLPGTGDPAEYNYIPVRASGFYGNSLNVNGALGGNNLYLRPRSGGEVRVTAAGTTDIYYDIRAGKVSGSSFITTTTNAYIGTNDELRVVNVGLTDTYRDVRAKEFIGSRLTLSSSFNTGYLRLEPRDEVRVQNTSNTYKPIRASAFPTGSSEIYKSDIKIYKEDALDILRKTVIYDYIKEGVTNRELGFIIEREFPEAIKFDDISINGYSHSSLNTKAIQELDVNLTTEVTRIDDRLSILELENQYLKQKIKQLEGAA